MVTFHASFPATAAIAIVAMFAAVLAAKSEREGDRRQRPTLGKCILESAQTNQRRKRNAKIQREHQYSPPEEEPGTLHRTKAEALAAEQK